MSSGWIKLHRKILDNDIFKNDKLFRVFMYLLLKASHSERDQLIGDSIVNLKAGQWATGRKAISRDTGLTEQNVRTAISKLEKLGILTIKVTVKYSIFSISNWDCYQQDNQQATNNQPTSNQQVTTINNVKNVKNVNNKDLVESEPQRKKFNFTDVDYQCAEWIYSLVKQVAPSSKKPNFESWANTVRLMRESDKLTHNDISEVFTWANQDSFWSVNILSATKLRQKFPQLQAKMKGVSNGSIKEHGQKLSAHERAKQRNDAKYRRPDECGLVVGTNDGYMGGAVDKGKGRVTIKHVDTGTFTDYE